MQEHICFGAWSAFEHKIAHPENVAFLGFRRNVATSLTLTRTHYWLMVAETWPHYEPYNMHACDRPFCGAHILAVCWGTLEWKSALFLWEWSSPHGGCVAWFGFGGLANKNGELIPSKRSSLLNHFCCVDPFCSSLLVRNLLNRSLLNPISPPKSATTNFCCFFLGEEAHLGVTTNHPFSWPLIFEKTWLCFDKRALRA